MKVQILKEEDGKYSMKCPHCGYEWEEDKVDYEKKGITECWNCDRTLVDEEIWSNIKL